MSSNSEAVEVLLIVSSYHLVIALCGLASIYMGYRLFKIGLFERAGELKVAWEGKSLALKQAAPGTFYAVLGTVIIGTAIVKGVELKGGQVAPAQDGTTTVPSFTLSALSGVQKGQPLGYIVRHALSEFAYCVVEHPTTEGMAGCDDHLRKVDLEAVPTRLDLDTIDRIEGTAPAQRSASDKDYLVSMRQRFLKPALR